MIKNLIPSENLLLHQKIKGCSYDLNRQELSSTLTESMMHHEGIGLSANQIGIDERVFTMILDIETKNIITCFNPRIVKYSKDEVVMEEGCLSYPELFLEVSRPSTIVVKFEDECKNRHKVRLTGLPARVFQHEHDHMEGIDFTQRNINT